MYSFGYSAMVLTSSHLAKNAVENASNCFTGKIAPSHNVKKNAARSSWAIPVPISNSSPSIILLSSFMIYFFLYSGCFPILLFHLLS